MFYGAFFLESSVFFLQFLIIMRDSSHSFGMTVGEMSEWQRETMKWHSGSVHKWQSFLSFRGG